MAPRRLALIFGLLLGASACGPVGWHFEQEDLSQGRGPNGRLIVGKAAILRLDHASAYRVAFDVIPNDATVLGAWIQTGTRGEVYEGPAGIFRERAEPRYVVTSGYGAGEPAKAPRLIATNDPRGSFTTVWIGPVCVQGTCETFRIDLPR